MPTPANGAAPVLPVSDLTNVKISRKGIDTTGGSNRLDASTLALNPGDDRVYVNGLPDSGAGGVDGVSATITCSFLTASAPVAGTDYTIDGDQYRCTESEVEYAVGELVKGTATFVLVPPDPGS
jgi:hypothetical protein